MARALVTASSQYLSRGNSLFTAPPATVAVWFKPTAVTDQTLFDIGSTTDSQYFEIRLNGSGDQIVGTFDGTTAGDARHDGSYSSGSWLHIVGVFASSTSRSIYTSGVLRETDTTSVNNPSGIDTTSFGSRLRAGSRDVYFGGSIAELAMWEVALDAAEIAALSKGVSPLLIRPQSLKSYWPLLDSAAPDVDRWKTRFDLTPSGAPTMAEHLRMFYPAVNGLTEVGANAYTLLAEFGTYALTGVATNLLAARRIVANTGSYALTGVATTLVHGYVMIAATGSYALTGIATTLSLIDRAFRRLFGSFITSRSVVATYDPDTAVSSTSTNSIIVTGTKGG